MNIKKMQLAIVGLGYAGLPLALEFAKKRNVVAYDINSQRIKNLQMGFDKNREFSKKQIKQIKKIQFTNNQNDLADCNVFIISVPTPISKKRTPDLKILKSASKVVGKFVKENDIIIYESTVYPGVTEEICVPILEKSSKLKYLNSDNLSYPGFFCGYSPERINPGDKKHNISNIVKVTSGSTPKVAKIIDKLYKEIVKAGTHLAPSIKIAEAAKVIENSQRDLNIAFVNELSIIFRKMNLDFKSIINAAKTKWNFIPFEPGLVGGHCIGVDPYYLTHKAKQIGYRPKIILSGRQLNDNMSKHVANQFLKNLQKRRKKIPSSKTIIMGVSFKENCSDFRNSKIIDIYKILKNNKLNVDLYDPIVDKKDFFQLHKIKLIPKIRENFYDAAIIAVPHEEIKKIGIDKIRKILKKNSFIFDIKGIFGADKTDLRL